MFKITRKWDFLERNKVLSLDEIISPGLKVSLVNNTLPDTQVPKVLEKTKKKLFMSYPVVQYLKNLIWYRPLETKASIEDPLYFHGNLAQNSVLYRKMVNFIEIFHDERKYNLYTYERNNGDDRQKDIFTIEYEPLFGRLGTIGLEKNSHDLYNTIHHRLMGSNWNFQVGFCPIINTKKTGEDFWTENIQMDEDKAPIPLMTCRAMYTISIEQGLNKIFDQIFLPKFKSNKGNTVATILKLWGKKEFEYNNQLIFVYPTSNKMKKTPQTKKNSGELEQCTGFHFIPISPYSIATHLPSQSKKFFDRFMKYLTKQHSIEKSIISGINNVEGDSRKQYMKNEITLDTPTKEENSQEEVLQDENHENGSDCKEDTSKNLVTQPKLEEPHSSSNNNVENQSTKQEEQEEQSSEKNEFTNERFDDINKVGSQPEFNLPEVDNHVTNDKDLYVPEVDECTSSSELGSPTPKNITPPKQEPESIQDILDQVEKLDNIQNKGPKRPNLFKKKEGSIPLPFSNYSEEDIKLINLKLKILEHKEKKYPKELKGPIRPLFKKDLFDEFISKRPLSDLGNNNKSDDTDSLPTEQYGPFFLGSTGKDFPDYHQEMKMENEIYTQAPEKNNEIEKDEKNLNQVSKKEQPE